MEHKLQFLQVESLISTYSQMKKKIQIKIFRVAPERVLSEREKLLEQIANVGPYQPGLARQISTSSEASVFEKVEKVISNNSCAFSRKTRRVSNDRGARNNYWKRCAFLENTPQLLETHYIFGCR